MSELLFSFMNCTPEPQGPQLVIPVQSFEEQVVITVRATGCTLYRYMERVARHFRRWLTVTAEGFRHVVTRARELCRSTFAAKAHFNRTVFDRQGGLRL